MKRLQYIWEKLNASFWFLPVLMVFTALLLAFSFIQLDLRTAYQPDGLFRFLFTESIDSTRSLLTIIASAMIGIGGTVFSITLVVLTLASSQLGSRLVRNFMHDKLTQSALGTFVATFVYCLIVFNAINKNDDIVLYRSFLFL